MSDPIWIRTFSVDHQKMTSAAKELKNDLSLIAATCDFQQCGMCDQKGSDQPTHRHSLIRSFANHFEFEFLSLKEGCTGLSESTHVKTPHCWKSTVAAQLRMTLGMCNEYHFLSLIYHTG